MLLDLKSLLAKTELRNKDCVLKLLEGQGFTTLPAIDNLPGKYGLAFLCENGTTVVVAELRRVIQETADALPTVNEAIKVAETAPEPAPEPEKAVIRGDTPVTDLSIEGVTPKQLRSIRDAGVETAGELFSTEVVLEDISGIGAATKDRILRVVTEALESQ